MSSGCSEPSTQWPESPTIPQSVPRKCRSPPRPQSPHQGSPAQLHCLLLELKLMLLFTLKMESRRLRAGNRCSVSSWVRLTCGESDCHVSQNPTAHSSCLTRGAAGTGHRLKQTAPSLRLTGCLVRPRIQPGPEAGLQASRPRLRQGCPRG